MNLAALLTPTHLPALLALLCYAVAVLPGSRAAQPQAPQRLANAALIAGWVMHGVAIVVGALGAIGPMEGPFRGVRFGFGPALSITVWLVVAVYAIESRLLPLPRSRRVLALLAYPAVGLALAFPGEVFEQHAPWAPVHWLLGIASYGLFGVAVFHAVLLSRADRRMRGGVGPAAVSGGLPLLGLERLTFRFVWAGFVALSATLVLGWWFTTVWKWDHKTVFSLLAWFVFAGLLGGRAAFGWRGRRASRWLYAGAVLLLLAYVGSRFVLEVLLHRDFTSA